MAKVRLLVDLPDSSSQLIQGLRKKGLRYEQVQSLQFLLAELSSGMTSARVNVQIGNENGESASGTLTISSSGAQSVSINGEALTGGTDYVIANLSASAIALNLAAAIRSSQKSKVQAVLAEASGAVVTVLAKEAGAVGNLIALAATGAAAAGASTLAGGSDPTQNIYLFNRKA